MQVVPRLLQDFTVPVWLCSSCPSVLYEIFVPVVSILLNRSLQGLAISPARLCAALKFSEWRQPARF